MITSTVLSTEEISQTIRDIVSDNEDAFQDTWVAVIERQLQDRDAIQETAKAVKKQHSSATIQHIHKTTSLFAPLKNDSDSDNFTLESIIPSKPLVFHDDDNKPYKQNGKPNQKNTVGLDSEVVAELHKRYPGVALKVAIRNLLGLPMLEAIECWQSWEDNIIKERYPWGGSMAISTDVDRSPDAIRGRARKLGIRKGTYRPSSAWLTSQEVANIFGSHYTIVVKWVNAGLLESTRVSGKGKKGFMFFTQKQIANFMEHHTFTYPHERVREDYQRYIPKWLIEWLTLCQASPQVGFTRSGLQHFAIKGKIPTKRGYFRQWYVRIEDIKHYLEARQKQSKKQPYSVTLYNGLKHYIWQDEDGDYYLRCRSRETTKPILSKAYKRHLHLAQGYPTCKVCLGILKTYRKQGK